MEEERHRRQTRVPPRRAASTSVWFCGGFEYLIYGQIRGAARWNQREWKYKKKPVWVQGLLRKLKASATGLFRGAGRDLSSVKFAVNEARHRCRPAVKSHAIPRYMELFLPSPLSPYTASNLRTTLRLYERSWYSGGANNPKLKFEYFEIHLKFPKYYFLFPLRYF